MVLLATNIKTCCGCEKTLTIENFYKKGARFDARCKSCTLVQKKDKYLSNKSNDSETFKDIFILPFNSTIDSDLMELEDALEAFLMEEFEGARA